MIFVTVGGQGSFERLVDTVDDWAGRREPAPEVFAQIGPAKRAPRHLDWARALSPSGFRDKARASELVVSHAGMGTVLTALEFGTPLLVMPRRAALGEQRNDHQIDTARRLRELPGVVVAADEDELRGWLDRIPELTVQGHARTGGGRALVDALRRWIDGP